MLRLLFLTVFFAALAMAASWLSAHPGQVTLVWMGWRVDSSASFLLFGIAVLALLCGAALAGLSGLLRMPWHWKNRRRERDYARGLRTLTGSFVALASGDVRAARIELKAAQKYLGQVPITLLLAAQMARLEGNDAETRGLLESMLVHKETRRLAARGLSEYHDRRGEAAEALPHAMQAAADHPADRDALVRLVGLHARLGNWQQAQAALKRAAWVVPRQERKRLLALVYAAHAKDLQAAGEDKEAYAVLRHAMKLLPDFAPLFALAAKHAPTEQRPAMVVKTLRAAWKRQPHPVLADALLDALENASPDEIGKAARKVAMSYPAHEESQLLLARAAIKTQDWDAARTALKNALAERESRAACTLMATLEETQYRDADASARWSLKAQNAEADPAWACNACDAVSPEWQPHCPACQAFGSLEWKRRQLRYAA